jgi:NADPH:quinone reductase-like Zn-dependent oxidoreductase
MMKAIVLKQFGGLEQLICRDIPQPEPRAGEGVMRVQAFGLNRARLCIVKRALSFVPKLAWKRPNMRQCKHLW